jgi:hypothetical protein
MRFMRAFTMMEHKYEGLNPLFLNANMVLRWMSIHFITCLQDTNNLIQYSMPKINARLKLISTK